MFTKINTYYFICHNKQQQILLRMTENEEKQIKEYKQFTVVTNIRKLTQEAINPVVKSIQTQMNRLLADNLELKKNMAKIQQVYKQNFEINKIIDQNFQKFIDYKEQQNCIKQKEKANYNRILNTIDKLNAETESIRSAMQNQNDYIDSMKRKNQKMSALYSHLDTRNEIALKNMQQKHTNFTNQMLTQSNRIKQFYDRSSHEMAAITQMMKREKDSFSDKLKTLQLFELERNSINEKFEDIYSKIIIKVNKDEFEGFRKTQNKFIEEKMQSVDAQMLQILPHSMRELLPKIQKKIRKVDNIQSIQKRITKVEGSLTKFNENFEQLKYNLNNEICTLQGKFGVELDKIKSHLKRQMKSINTRVQQNHRMIQNRVVEVKKTIQYEIQEKMDQKIEVKVCEKVSQKLEIEGSSIHQTIQQEINLNQQVAPIINQTNQQLQQILKQINEIKSFKQAILEKSQLIGSMADNIQSTLQSYSNRITKIKSDYQMFANNMTKQVHLATKMKDAFSENLSDVGSVLSAMAEFLLMSGSLHYHNIIENNKANGQNANEVYVTSNDGIIYQYKNEGKNSKIIYRKNKMELKYFVKSYMYSMVNYFDEIFTSHLFLNWKQHKPSKIFKSKCLQNYMVRLMKLSETSQGAKSTNNIMNKQKNSFQNDEFQNAMLQVAPNNHFCKAINHTLESRKNLIHTHTNGQKDMLIEENLGNLKKNYSIKKPRTSMEKIRYEQQYLTSRSGCRSKLSQAF